MRIAFRLAWPPSVNTYWRSPNSGPLAGRVLISRAGREYRRQVEIDVLRQRVPRHALIGKMSITVMACPPDRRLRDLSNLWKGLEDSLQHAGVIRDDGDFDDMRIWRGPIVTGGLVHVDIAELAGPTSTIDLPLMPRPASAEEAFS